MKMNPRENALEITSNKKRYLGNQTLEEIIRKILNNDSKNKSNKSDEVWYLRYLFSRV